MNVIQRIFRKIDGYQEQGARWLRERPWKKLYRIYEKYRAYTMIERDVYVRNLALIEKSRQVPGAVVECGVWKGGMSAGIAELLGEGRNYHLFDSFEGLPKAQEIDGPRAVNWQKDTTSPFFYDNAAADRRFCEEAMAKSGIRSYTVHPGWFEQTLSGFRVPEGIAVLRLDGDWYESTMTCLKFLFPQVNAQGLILVDDYYAFEGCARALHDFLSQNKLGRRIRQFDNDVCYLINEDHHSI